MNGYLPNSQIAAANNGLQYCYDTNLEDNCAIIAQAQVAAGVTQYMQRVLAGLGGIRETPANQINYIVTNLTGPVKKTPATVEGGPCPLTPIKLEALVSAKELFAERFCITAEEIAANDTGAVAAATDRLALNLVRRFAHLILEAVERALTSPDYYPYHDIVEPAVVRGLEAKAFGVLNRGTIEFARVIAQATSIIHRGGGVADTLVVPPALIPLIKTLDEVALSADFVGSSGILARTSPDQPFTSRFAGLAIVPSTGLADDPLVSSVVAVEHFSNARKFCGDVSRCIEVDNHVTGEPTPVDFAEAVRNSRMFGPDGNVDARITELVDTYNARGTTPWSERFSPHGDPLAGGASLGPLTYRDDSGKLRVSRVFGQMKVDNLRRFAASVLATFGDREAAQVRTHLSSLRRRIRAIHALGVPTASGWTASQPDETGAIRDTDGNFTLEREDALTLAGLAGYGSGPGIAHVASLAPGETTSNLLESIADEYASAELLGEHIRTYMPDSAIFNRPAYYHGSYTPGMAVVDVIAGAQVNVFETGGGAPSTGISLPATLPTDNQEAINAIARALSNPAATGGAASADEIMAAQERLVTIYQSGELQDEALELLNSIAALAAPGNTFASVATFDVRAAKVLDQRLTTTTQRTNALEVIWSILASFDARPNSRYSPEQMDAAREVVRRVAAAVLAGYRFDSIPGDIYNWFENSTPKNDAAAAALAAASFNLALGGGGDSAWIRTPLVVPAGTTNDNVGTLATPWRPQSAGGAAAGPADAAAGVGQGGAADDGGFGARIGAMMGAGEARGTGEAATGGAPAFGSETMRENLRRVQALNVHAQVVGEALLSTPVTRDATIALVENAELDLPFSFLGYRASRYNQAYSAYVMDGGPETTQLVHSRIQTGMGRDQCLNVTGVVKVQAVGVVLKPQNIVRLPYVYLQEPDTSTSDASFKNDHGEGAMIFTFADNTYAPPATLPLSGLDETGRLINPVAPILYTLWDGLDDYMPASMLWDRNSAVSYQGREIAMTTNGRPRTIPAAGPFAE